MKVTLAGYYGYDNLGDELILLHFINEVRARWPDASITVLSGNPPKTNKEYKVQSVGRWNFLSVSRAILNSDFLVLGGGGLIQDQTSFLSLLYYLGLMTMARLFNRPTFLFSIGVEGIHRSFSKMLIRRIFSPKTVGITVRDIDSQKALVDAGVDRQKIMVTGDPVFGLNSPELPSRVYSDTQNIFIIPRYQMPEKGFELYRKVIDKLSQNKSTVFHGCLFQEKREKYLIHKMPSLINWASSEDIITNRTAELLLKLKKCDFVVGSRLHGLILALLVGKPFVGIGDPHKIGRFCRSWDMPFISWQDDMNQIVAALNQVKNFRSSSIQNRVSKKRLSSGFTYDAMNRFAGNIRK